MGKWYGKVGYIIQEEVEPGTWLPTAIEKQYYGDALSTVSRWNQSGNVNSDLNITNKISILADPFAYQNFSNIKYVEYMDALWNVESIEVQQPRLILNVGGVYNGQTPNVTE